MSIRSWLGAQAIRSLVGQMPFKEVRVSKWILAVVAAVGAFAAAIASGLEVDSLSFGTLMSAISAGVLAGVGKLYDPGAVLKVPRLLKALGLAVGAAVVIFSAAVVPIPPEATGVVTISEWGSIATTFLITFWAKWSTPDKLVS